MQRTVDASGTPREKCRDGGTPTGNRATPAGPSPTWRVRSSRAPHRPRAGALHLLHHCRSPQAGCRPVARPGLAGSSGGWSGRLHERGRVHFLVVRCGAVAQGGVPTEKIVEAFDPFRDRCGEVVTGGPHPDPPSSSSSPMPAPPGPGRPFAMTPASLKARTTPAEGVQEPSRGRCGGTVGIDTVPFMRHPRTSGVSSARSGPQVQGTPVMPRACLRCGPERSERS